MKIAIDARMYHSSHAGIGRYTRALVRELASLDKTNDYTIILTKKDTEEYDIKNKNFKTIIVDFIHFTFAEQTKLYKILNKENFDLVHFTNFNHPIFFKGKFVVTMHDLTLMLFPSGRQKSFIKQLVFKKVLKNAVNKAKKIIAISKATKNDLVKYLDADRTKIDVIYEGVDPEYLPNEKLKSKNSKLLNNYKITKPYILFVSQWRPHKGLPDLIRAFEILKRDNKYKDLKLVITGKPDKGFPDLPRSIDSSLIRKDIITTGFVPDEDLPIIYNHASVFVFPSHYEGFGLTPLEAMACGAPVVSSNLSCMPEILGDAALYFNPNNHKEMAEKINQILSSNEKREALVAAGFLRVKKYSWEKMAKETLKIYEQIIKNKQQ